MIIYSDPIFITCLEFVAFCDCCGGSGITISWYGHIAVVVGSLFHRHLEAVKTGFRIIDHPVGGIELSVGHLSVNVYVGIAHEGHVEHVVHRDVIRAKVGVGGIVFTHEEASALRAVKFIAAQGASLVFLQPYVIVCASEAQGINAHAWKSVADAFKAAVFVAGREYKLRKMTVMESGAFRALGAFERAKGVVVAVLQDGNFHVLIRIDILQTIERD